ncbi:LysE family translocator [Streptomyces sp. NPDC102406]|uniref:LysE family translocator n=1 Tax=Streptomyces sp. NPDC102406 TaxID=3366171 RepID=UPI003821883A
MTADLWGFLAVVMVAYLVPGPDFLVVVRCAADNAAKGRAAALGAQSGLCVHMAAAVVGLSVIAARSALVFQTIKLLGAAYLVHLGVRAVLAARRVPGTAGAAAETAKGAPETGGARALGPRWRSGFAEGLLTNVLNPKAALFFLSVLPQFVDGDGSATRQILFLGALDIVIGLAYWCVLVAVAARLRALLARPAIRRRWEALTGWLLITAGGGVAASS